MDERPNTHTAAAFLVAWMALLGASAVLCSWCLAELRSSSARAYMTEYVDVDGRHHTIRASSPGDLESMLRAMEARFPSDE